MKALKIKKAVLVRIIYASRVYEEQYTSIVMMRASRTSP